jgi:hypothetical protein
VGLGLWNSRAGSLAVELGLFVVATALYLGATRAQRTRGHVALWTFLGFVLLSFLGNLGAPPPSELLLAVGALSAWLYLPWLSWVERNRRYRGVEHPIEVKTPNSVCKGVKSVTVDGKKVAGNVPPIEAARRP